MKKIALGLLITCISINLLAQQDAFPKKDKQGKSRHGKSERRPILFINASTGINNNTGLLGVSAEFPITSHFSVEGGAGISTWGSKLTASCKYYLNDDFKGWAFGAGFTYNTGINNFQDNLETVTGSTETVMLDLYSRANIFGAAYKYWRLGKRSNRIYLELGYSVAVSGGPKFDQTSGDPISDNSNTAINLICPGGPIVGFGFSFGIH